MPFLIVLIAVIGLSSVLVIIVVLIIIISTSVLIRILSNILSTHSSLSPPFLIGLAGF